MYLSGMDIHDIMKITGHTSLAMLRKYIKAENLTVVEKITDKYNYFDWWEKGEKGQNTQIAQQKKNA